MVGYMAMPANFRYAAVYVKGQPRHTTFDSFRLKHPEMDHSKRAKIFAPFDALKGFSEAVASKETLYENRKELSDETKEDIDFKLSVLHRLTINSRAARENRPQISVTYFIPCNDPDNTAYGHRGQYQTVTGVCVRVGMHSLYLDNRRIAFRDISAIQGEMLKSPWEDGMDWEDNAS